MKYLEAIKSEIEKILKDRFGVVGVNFQVGFPEDLKHGDVTTNVCLVASKLVAKSPREVGEVIIAGLQKLDFVCAPIEQVGPGFINIWLKQENVKKELEVKLGSDDTQFVSKKYVGKRVLVEHTSINLFKQFHIGHLMSNFTGEFVYRITKEVGGDSINLSYPSDISIGVAKAIYIIKQDGGLRQEIFKQSEREVLSYMGSCYVRGVADFKSWEEDKDSENSKSKIKEVKTIANNLFGGIPGEDFDIYLACKKANMDDFQRIVKTLGSEFKEFIYESEAGEEGKRIVLENTQSDNLLSKLFGGKKIFKRSEGAIIYVPDESRKDISTSVFINSEGNPTYLAKDIGLLSLKFKKYNPDLSIYVVDNEQNAHFKSVFDAGGKINKTWEEKSVHVSHGRMTFKGKKMSSRLGGVPSGEEVINAVLEEVKERSSGPDTKHEVTEEVQKEIALSALRVSILRSKPGVNIDFDPERSLSFEGDSGPYLCYTHARCCSLLEKSPRTDEVSVDPLYKGDTSAQGQLLIRKLFQFEKIVVDSAEEIAPQKLIKYLFEVAGEFNNFYAHNKIITENEAERRERMQLVYYTKKVLEKGLYLIGVKAPEKM